MRALVLLSGGLDSILAARIIQGQGIEVLGLHFISLFYKNRKEVLAASLGIEVKEVDISEEFIGLVKGPRYGFGSHLNPCIDCKILMLRKAGDLLGELGASFVVTGEVFGQRPMSQNKNSLKLIEKKSGLEGLLLRPLSAKLLEETVPEKRGWVNRQGLLCISGRGRRDQMELAKELGIKEYGQPAGGCLLTDPEFSKRLKDLIAHEGLSRQNIELLKLGRHFRIAPQTRLIVGRNQDENLKLENLAQDQDYLFMPGEDTAGPTSLGRGQFDQAQIELCCSINCRYCDLNNREKIRIFYDRLPDKRGVSLEVLPLGEPQVAGLRI